MLIENILGLIQTRNLFIDFHKVGFAHSVEVKNNELVGGLYGLSIGSIFLLKACFINFNASKCTISNDGQD